MKHSSVFEVGDTVTAVCKLSALVEQGARGTVRELAPYTPQALVVFSGWPRWVREDMIRHTFAVEVSDA